MNPTVLIIILLIAQASPLISVTTDRTWYAPGEQVQVMVRVDNGTLTSTVWFYVDKPDGRNLYFTYVDVTFVSATGFIFTLPSDAPEGMYTVTVTWDHQYAQTGFMVSAHPIPEFPVASLVLIVATAIAFFAISRRQASARSETLAPHP